MKRSGNCDLLIQCNLMAQNTPFLVMSNHENLIVKKYLNSLLMQFSKQTMSTLKKKDVLLISWSQQFHLQKYSRDKFS